MGILNEARGRLQVVVDKLDKLEANFQGAIEKKEVECKVRLTNADKLVGGLGSEEARWAATVDELNVSFTNLVGDVLASAGTVSYLGPFTAPFRARIVTQWREQLTQAALAHTEGCDIVQTMNDPVQLRMWQLSGLPTDNLSTQNGIMMDRARRWSLLIDPQGQANRYIRNQGKDKEMCANSMDVTKPS